MNSVFKEQIVKRQNTMTHTLMRIGMILAAVILCFLVMVIAGGFFGPLLVMAVVFGTWLGLSFLRVEYEYAFTDGELDIDVIYNRSRRKRVFNARVNDFEIMAHVEDNAHAHSFSNAQVTHNYSSGVVTENTYAFILNHKGKRTKVIIEPNAVMLKAMATVLTRRRLHVKV